ncbi:MAG: glycerate kinase [Clostridia bacterium]|nr:glycerate kinase [Clostridia bacterium]
MKVLVAIDSFKGSLTSLQAGNAVKNAILRVDENARVLVKPLADGGEGTAEALAFGLNVQTVKLTVNGPLLRPTEAKYIILKDTNTAVMEMAAAAGITLVSDEERNPLNTTTYGVGEIIKDAVKRGCNKFIVGIGGSATNDGGVGMLTALGFEFLDKDKKPIAFGAKGLKDLCSIKTDHVIPELEKCSFTVACDVTNPLCGKNGCSAVFAPQKGGTPDMIIKMDEWLNKYAKAVKNVFPKANPDIHGAGAAGGLGFAFMSFTNATLKPGIDIVISETGIENEIKNSDIVVTGEGKLDAQSIMGKAPVGIAKLAKKYGKKVVAFAGCVSADAEICNEHGIDAFFPILREVTSLDKALDSDYASHNLEAAAYQTFRLIYKIKV